MATAAPPIRALIVDDEYPARAELRYRLARHADVEVVGEAATAREALRLMEGVDYDVVFLDIAMPGLSGIELARRLCERPDAPCVVFVTAYDEYAVQAFETRAVDYLLKPFDDERLAETLARVRRLRRPSAAAEPPGARAALPEAGQGAAGPRWLMGLRDQAAVPVPLEAVVFIRAEGERVYLHTASDCYPARYTLRELEALLPAEHFFRCHRAYIVNLAKVREISPFSHGTYVLTMADRAATEVPVARGRVPQLKRRFFA